MFTVQVALPALGVTIAIACCWMLWPLLSLTLANAVHTTTPFFGTTELTVTAKVKTNLPVVAATAGTTSASWAKAGAQTTKTTAQSNGNTKRRVFTVGLLDSSGSAAGRGDSASAGSLYQAFPASNAQGEGECHSECGRKPGEDPSVLCD